MNHLRLTVRLLLIATGLIVALPIHLLWRLVRLPSPWPRLYLGYVARVIGARTRTLGEPLRRDVVFIANHLSWLDILLLAGRTGTAFVAKAELARIPLIGWLCRLNHTIFVSRADRLGVADQIEQLRTALADGWAVTIFPEGTTGDGRTLLPFKPALLAALEPPPPGVQVQPVRIDYGAATDELAWVGDEPGQHHALRVLARRGTLVATLTFLEPFVPEGGRKVIAAEARSRIEASGT